MLVLDLGGGKSRGAALLLDEPGLEAGSEDSTSTFFPLKATETLPTWMPGRYPFAAVSVYLRNHPGISQGFSGFYFAKLDLGWVEQTWLGSLKTMN